LNDITLLSHPKVRNPEGFALLYVLRYNAPVVDIPFTLAPTIMPGSGKGVQSTPQIMAYITYAYGDFVGDAVPGHQFLVPLLFVRVLLLIDE